MQTNFKAVQCVDVHQDSVHKNTVNSVNDFSALFLQRPGFFMNCTALRHFITILNIIINNISREGVGVTLLVGGLKPSYYLSR